MKVNSYSSASVAMSQIETAKRELGEARKVLGGGASLQDTDQQRLIDRLDRQVKAYLEYLNLMRSATHQLLDLPAIAMSLIVMNDDEEFFGGEFHMLSSGNVSILFLDEIFRRYDQSVQNFLKELTPAQIMYEQREDEKKNENPKPVVVPVSETDDDHGREERIPAAEVSDQETVSNNEPSVEQIPVTQETLKSYSREELRIALKVVRALADELEGLDLYADILSVKDLISDRLGSSQS